MVALDANVLLRLLLADDADQAERASRLVARAGEAGEELFVGDIVLCEFAWVLQRLYGLARGDVAAAIRNLLGTRELVFRDRSAISAAAKSHALGAGDFADHLIAATARAAGCEAVATFDEKLQALPGFVAP